MVLVMGRSTGLLFLFLLSALVWSTPAWAQWQKNQYQLQKEAAAQVEPAPLLIERRGPRTAPTVLRVRFYADSEFRSTGGVRWQDRVRAQLQQINQLLEPAFAVRLEAESFRRWDRQGQSGALAPMLEQLERHDAGADVDWVVGLVAALPAVSMSFHDLGWATILGRHFVLRSMSSIVELDDFNRAFHALDRAQREALYSRRKAHKENAIFLHEWAHTLGALHVQDGNRVMSGGYSHRCHSFNASDAALLAAGLAARIQSRGQAAVDWTPLRTFLAENNSADWLRADRAALDRSLAGGTGRSSAGPPTATARPAAASAPAAATDPPFVAQVRAHLAARRPAEALVVTRKAAERARAEGDAGVWVAIARSYGEIGALSEADEALKRAAGAPGVPAVSEQLLRWRRSFGLPRNTGAAGKGRFKLAAEAEPDYVAAVQRVRKLLSNQDSGQSRQAAEAELRRFPGAPGLLVVSCEALMLASREREAIRACGQAIKAMEDLPRAHYLLGLMSANGGNLDQAMKALRRAIDIDPSQQLFWTALGEVYRVSGRSKEFRALLADQEKAFQASAPAGN